jgi:methyl-accepting chemotaxis protein/methyl-accepting chemotaxis protein-1 (serine sensor receptor)
MGFAVVADEVRNLAQRSAQAARDTAGLIESSLQKTQSGMQKVETVAGSIASMTDGVGRVKGLIEEVSQASTQQAQGIDQVSRAIAQMEKVTQVTAATAEEGAAASEELNAQAEAAMGVVTHLEALVGTGAGRRHAPAQTATPTATQKPAAHVLRMPAAKGAGRAVSRPAARQTAAQTAEDLFPMEDTGTFGKF